MPTVSRLVKERNDRIIYLTKYALIHPESRNVEYLISVSKGVFSTSRAVAMDDAKTALGRIATKGDQYGISPESKQGKQIPELDPTAQKKVVVFGAGMGEIPPEEIKPLTAEEEKAIMETSIFDIIAHDKKNRPGPPMTDFKVIEEDD